MDLKAGQIVTVDWRKEPCDSAQDPERFQSWQTALQGGEPFLDVSSGATGFVIRWEGRSWVVILSQDGQKVVTTYPTDERTVANRRGGGRWIVPNN